MFFDVECKIQSVQEMATGTYNQVHTTLMKAIGLNELQNSQVSISTLQNRALFSFMAKLFLLWLDCLA